MANEASLKETLAVIIPVYNEQEAIEKVLTSWDAMLSSLGINYTIHSYDDGSRDQSLATLRKIETRLPRVRAHTKTNSGHGPTILLGYQQNIGATWLFQVDSDDELRPTDFSKLWNQRADYDFLIGRRAGRASPLSRKVVSFISRLTVRLGYGKGIWDVNSPYRLFRTSVFRETVQRIPADTFAPNVLIAADACRFKSRILEVQVTHFERETGEVSIKKWRLLKAAFKSFAQTVSYRFNQQA